MNRRLLLTRLRARLAKDAKRVQLEVRKRHCGGDLFVDYGWIRLLYSGDSDDQEILYHLHQKRWYVNEMEVFRNLIGPGQTAIDVGANMGFLTTVLASIVGQEGRVISFEPSGPVYEKLLKTIAANGLHQVVPLNLGCGAASATARLDQVTGSSGSASIIGAGQDATEIRVERLDDVPEVWATPVSLLKIDTEGYEPEVLEGAQRLIAERKPVIRLEMGGEYVDSTLRSIALLTDYGYDTQHIESIDWSRVGNGSDYVFFPRP